MSSASHEWGLAHEQTVQSRTFYVRSRFKKRQRPTRVVEARGSLPTVQQVAHPDNLIAVYYELKGTAGQAPGPDGLGYADLGRREVADVMRTLSHSVLAGTYRPGPTRPVNVPKPKGGHRTLKLAGIIDRVVASSLNKAMTPFWEGIFLPCSFGFRPARDAWSMLAALEAAMSREGRWVLASDDVKQAFDNVAIDDVMGDHRRHIDDDALLTLTGVVLRGGDDGRRRGIDQGSAYSPTALNVRLHHAFDLGVHQGHHPLRYADNLVFACRSVSEGRQALRESSQQLMEAGFTLKGEDGDPVDLSLGGKAQLLGFTLAKKGEGLGFDLGQEAWVKLEQNLLTAYRGDDPTHAARDAVRGWINFCGPAFESKRSDSLQHLRDIAGRVGFRELVVRQTSIDG